MQTKLISTPQLLREYGVYIEKLRALLRHLTPTKGDHNASFWPEAEARAAVEEYVNREKLYVIDALCKRLEITICAAQRASYECGLNRSLSWKSKLTQGEYELIYPTLKEKAQEMATIRNEIRADIGERKYITPETACKEYKLPRATFGKITDTIPHYTLEYKRFFRRAEFERALKTYREAHSDHARPLTVGRLMAEFHVGGQEIDRELVAIESETRVPVTIHTTLSQDEYSTLEAIFDADELRREKPRRVQSQTARKGRKLFADQYKKSTAFVSDAKEQKTTYSECKDAFGKESLHGQSDTPQTQLQAV
jgi:hypothetical protein